MFFAGKERYASLQKGSFSKKTDKKDVLKERGELSELDNQEKGENFKISVSRKKEKGKHKVVVAKT